VRIKVAGAPAVTLTVIDYAWKDAGDRIRTGQTTSNPNNFVDGSNPGSLGSLALGAAGLDAWRNRPTHDRSAIQN
jgi:hypothetical protein